MLAVHYGFMHKSKYGPYLPPAWRVAWLQGKHRMALRVCFARRRDAEIGLEALKRAGITNLDDVLKIGRDACKRIMCEALPW